MCTTKFLRWHISTIITLPSPIVTWISDHSKGWANYCENFECFDLILMECWPNIKLQIPSTEWDWWCLITVSLQRLQQWWSREELHTASPLPAPDQCLLKTTDNSIRRAFSNAISSYTENISKDLFIQTLTFCHDLFTIMSFKTHGTQKKKLI